MKDFMHIISTRKLTAVGIDRLKAHEWKITAHDFICKLINIPPDLSPQSISDNVVITSKMGVSAFLDILKLLSLDKNKYQVYCLSAGTKEFSLSSGLRVRCSAPDANALATEILKDPDVKEVTHISSNVRRQELSETLIKSGVDVRNIVGYHTTFTPFDIGDNYDAILFFSPSAVESFLTLNPLKNVPCFCIGKTTASYAKEEGFQQVHISDLPAEVNLVDAVINYYSKSPADVKE